MKPSQTMEPCGFGDPPSVLPRWGTERREQKAQQIFATVSSSWRQPRRPLAETRWCDLGCGNGVIAATLSLRVERVVGIDSEPWPGWEDLTTDHGNLELRADDIEKVRFAGSSFDVVVCNQVYEHVGDPQALLATIDSLLEPGGLCYFAGPNLLFPVEPHVFWPFVHWLPRRLARGIMSALGSSKELDAHSVDYWTLRRWLERFEVENALPYVVRNPQAVGRSSSAWMLAARLPDRLLHWLTPFSPAFVFILRKHA